MSKTKLSPKGYPIPKPRAPRPSGSARRQLPLRGRGWVPVPSGPKIPVPEALPPFPLPAPLKRALRVVNPLRRLNDAWDLGFAIGQGLKGAISPDLLPFGAGSPTRVTFSGASDYYDCPSISHPYSTPAMIYFSSVGAATVPAYLKCTPLQVPNGRLEEMYPDGYEGAPFVGRVAVGPGAVPVGGVYTRMSMDEVWVSRAPGMRMRVQHQRKPTFIPAPDPSYWPSLDPLTLPIYRPHPGAKPLPMHVVRRLPERLPFTREAGNGLRQSPALNAAPGPLPTIIIGPRPQPQPKPEPYYPGRPPKGTRERKLLADKRLAAPRGLLETASEMRDAIQAIHDALPKRLQKAGDKDMVGMLRDIYQNMNAVDWQKAIGNLAYNWAEDKVVGRLDAAINKAGVKLGVGGAAIKNPITSAPNIKW